MAASFAPSRKPQAMNRQPFQTPPRWWEPKLNPLWVRLCRPLRRNTLFRKQRLVRIDVHGLDHLRRALDEGKGVMITPNHSAHYDSNVLYEVSDRLGRPFHFLTAWQVFAMSNWFERLMLTRHGCFSIDRESTDLRAFRQAIDILRASRYPLVVFPEGDIYHLSDRVTPFREGAAAIALAAAKKAPRPVVCIPCGIKFRYTQDPTPELLRLMDKLERRLFRRPRPEQPLAERIYRFAEAVLVLKELEYLGQPATGPVAPRTAALADAILRRLEDRYGVSRRSPLVPERVKELRRLAIQQLEKAAGDEAKRQQLTDDLDDLFFVVQLFSYPGDYVAEQPSIERLAETLDKFEEDLLEAPTAGVRGKRQVLVRFGEPIEVRRGPDKKDGVAQLTRTLEKRVQALLDEMNAGTNHHPASGAR
jgi:1-acyl-sn-glycerol-3-phosphate acyltransferase